MARKSDRSPEELRRELAELRRRFAELEQAEAERREAQKALESAERERTAILDTMSEHVVYQDLDHRVVWTNRAAAESVDLSPEELAGRLCYEVWADRNNPCDGCPIIRARETRQPQQSRMTTPDGRTWLVRGYPVLDEDGAVTNVVEVTMNITARERAEMESQRRATQLETLRRVGLEITTQLNLEVLLHSIVSQAIDLLEAEEGGLYLYRPERDVLEWVVAIGSTMAPVGATLRRGEGLSGKVWETGEPLMVDDYKTWEGRPGVYEGAPWTAVLAVPVHWRDNFLGVLNVVAAPPRTFSSADAELLTLFAAQAAIAIENARLFQAEREQRELAQALEEAAAAVSSTLHLDQVLDRILEQIARVVDGDAFNILLVEEGDARRVRWRGYEDLGVAPSPHALSIASHPTLSEMVQTGEPLIVSDTSTHPEWVPAEGQEWLRSYVGVPIQVGGVTVGFLNVDGTRPGQFGPTDGLRLKAFAPHAATAIENAQLYRELLNRAEQLEQRVEERTAQLRAQYAQSEAVLRSATDGIIVTDDAGNIVQTNPVADAWLHRTLSPEDADRLRETVQDLADRGDERPKAMLELTGLDLELKAAPVLGPTGQAKVVIAVHDVSHLKALDRIKSRFISNISHELRTPITTIKLYALLIERHPDKWQEYMETLMEEADRQAQLVEDIMEISRIDAGRLEIAPQPTPLNDLIEMVMERYRTLAEERGLTLTHHALEPQPVALVDPELMTQVLDNLIQNAIRYTAEGGRVGITAGKQEKDDRVWATLQVTDTGMGIPEDELPHVFDRFFRGSRPRAMQLSGTGVGLALVKEIVELHGGQVTAQSAVEEGSTFTVWLPLTEKAP